jgi:demethoxyubiquinone hydroxylase (CLK1/Coq7/Cat5 family)
MDTQPRYKLSDLTPEELNNFVKELENFLNERSIFMQVRPSIVNPTDPEGSFGLGTTITFSKKILEEVEESIPSPFTEETNNEPNKEA